VALWSYSLDYTLWSVELSVLVAGVSFRWVKLEIRICYICVCLFVWCVVVRCVVVWCGVVCMCGV
jgi:hypothetical protein